MQLRGYQSAAVGAVWNYLRERSGNPCVSIPTGGGKSPVIAQLCKDAIAWRGRVSIVTHRKELIEQNFRHIETLMPGIRVGVYSAGLGSRDTSESVVVCGIQSVYQRAEEFGSRDLIIVDEAHRIPESGEGMYRSYLEACRKLNPDVRLVGMTATPYRTSTGLLCGPDNLLNEICYEIGVRELIRDGWLAPLRSKSCREKIDTSNVTIRAGEFVLDELQAAAIQDADKIAMACMEIGERSADCRSVLVFSCGVEHAKLVRNVLSDLSETRLILGDTPADERALTLADFKAGRFKYLVNVDVLTEGFDAPNVDCVAVMRPTMSPGLWTQMVGRGCRLAPGKKDCLVLDFGGNALRHGPIDRVNQQTRKMLMSEGRAPFKECPDCAEAVPAGAGVCLVCGHKFERQVVRHADQAHASDAMSGEEVFDVLDVDYVKHYKKGDPACTGRPTLRVIYDIGTMYGVSEWICIEHTGFARSKAVAWWRDRLDGDIPMTIDDALAISSGLKVPKRVAVRMEGKYPRITRYEELHARVDDEVPF